MDKTVAGEGNGPTLYTESHQSTKRARSVGTMAKM